MSATAAARLRARSHPAYIAFVVHRLSGVALTLFLPLHFWALSQALNGAEGLAGFLAWADNPAVKLAETALVLMLSLHLAGGLRLLALELLAWREWQKSLAAVGAGASLAVTLIFALRLV